MFIGNASFNKITKLCPAEILYALNLLNVAVLNYLLNLFCPFNGVTIVKIFLVVGSLTSHFFINIRSSHLPKERDEDT